MVFYKKCSKFASLLDKSTVFKGTNFLKYFLGLINKYISVVRKESFIDIYFTGFKLNLSEIFRNGGSIKLHFGIHFRIHFRQFFLRVLKRKPLKKVKKKKKCIEFLELLKSLGTK